MTVVGFAPDEIAIDAPTREARLRWVIVVDGTLDRGRAANAIACLAAAAGAGVRGLLGPDGSDADGGAHPGLPWAGCSILAAEQHELGTVRGKAAARGDIHVIDMPGSAQTNRVYRAYLDELETTPAVDLGLLAVSFFGPRNPVDRLVGKLPLYR